MIRKFGRVKREAIIALALMAALAVAGAEDAPVPPSQSTDEVEEPALPASEAVPLNPGPGLLPESNELPPRPQADAKSSPTRQVLKKEGRFDTVLSLAVSNRHAAYLLKRARQSSNSVSRRTYLRSYYMAVASRMRKLNPKLESSINAYEETKLREISGVRTSTERASSHRTRRHRTARLAGRRKLHRVSSEDRYRRIIIMDAPYGPEFPPYGPVVFEPW